MKAILLLCVLLQCSLVAVLTADELAPRPPKVRLLKAVVIASKHAAELGFDDDHHMTNVRLFGGIGGDGPYWAITFIRHDSSKNRQPNQSGIITVFVEMDGKVDSRTAILPPPSNDQRKGGKERREKGVPSIRKKVAEQGDAVQPATAEESKAEGSEKPKPDSEGRSQ